ncbi:helix-turn-helix domain-containing protein [Devosia sp.]|uniref:helix-turn-helix domain-containing protein n=1 Tax=Devosia sp. TaxID=1871048 RepID=UPI003A909CCA
MDKRDRAALFKSRLNEAVARLGWSQSRLAIAAGLDRSTVSQLLGAEEPRLPSGQALGQIAGALQVSADWLLGLSNHHGVASEILEQAVQMTEAAWHPVDEQVLAWTSEVPGAKVRHVPSGMPHIFKTDAVLTFEYSEAVVRTPRQAISDSEAQLALLRRPETDMEIAVPVQVVEAFAAGQWQWSGLDAAVRREQLERMAADLSEFYPSARLYAYDLRQRYSVPFLVFGQQRVAIYVGQRYLAFTAPHYIQLMARHFDDLVRAAVVHGHEASDWVAGLAKTVK